jgi:beta-N-acetylhexosaminidase
MLNQINLLPIESKIGQLFVIGIPGTETGEAARGILGEVRPGGVCLFARNIRDAGQTRQLLEELRELLPINPFLSLDQEGGLVDRLRRIVEPMPAAASLRSPEDAETLARLTSEAMRILGFNMNYAPVIDVAGEGRPCSSNGLTSRTFGSGADDAARFGRAYLEALQEGGVTGCLKHFPGLGASAVDSHEDLPLVGISETELRSADLLPYREIIRAGSVRAVMAAHAAYPRADLQERDSGGKLLPSSLSPRYIKTILRSELGYDGLVLTDDLEMGAVVNHYGIGEACKMALRAGNDQLLVCNDPELIREGYHSVLAAVRSGEIGEDEIGGPLRRIAAAKEMLSPPLPFDRERLDEISAEIAHLKNSIQ